MKNAILLLFVFCLNIKAYTQPQIWELIKGPNYLNMTRPNIQSDTKNNLFTVVKSKLAISTDNGITWALLSSAPTTVFYFFVDKSDNIITITNGALYVSSDQGTTWKTALSFTKAITPWGIKNNSDNEIVAFGTGGVFASTDKGFTWEKRSADSLLQIVINKAGVMIAQRFRTSEIVISFDGGKTWNSTGTTGLNLNNFYLDSDGNPVLFTDKKIVKIVNNKLVLEAVTYLPDVTSITCAYKINEDVLFGTSTQGVYLLRNSDKSVTPLAYNINFGVDILMLIQNQLGNILAFTSYGCFKANDITSSWERINIDLGMQAMLDMTIFKTDTFLVFIYHCWHTYSLKDNKWDLFVSPSSPVSSTTTFKIVYYSPNEWFGMTADKLYFSTDQGNNWTECVINGTSFNKDYGYHFVKNSEGTYYSTIGTNYTTHYLIYSKDNCKTWNKLDQTLGSDLFQIDSKNRIYSIYKKDLYISSDKGFTWQIITMPTNIIGKMVIDKNNVIYLELGTDTVVSSNDLGKTWTQKSHPFLDLFVHNMEGLLVDSNNILYCYNAQKDVYYSNDGAISWHTLGLGSQMAIYNLLFDGTGNMYIVTDPGLYKGKIPNFLTSNSTAVLVSPAKNVQLNIDPKNPFAVLTWNKSSDAFTYTVEVSYDNTFNSIIYTNTLEGQTDTLKNIQSNKTYYWRVRPIGLLNPGNWSETWNFNSALLDVNTPDMIPNDYKLDQNYPNPFNPETKISYSIKEKSMVTLSVHDMLGRLVETLVNEEKAPGEYTASWHPINKASGIYYYQIIAGDFNSIRKMVFLK